ncbi:MAG: hypothetical protein DAHOPDDO_02985 [Ignavibacteriaceae bacterium]|nr:hypothetical protein [Ignavibacteriaceae bacterium]
MKKRKGFSNFFFHPNPMGLIIILLLFFNSIAIAQEQTPPKEIILDGAVSYEGLFIEPIYNSFIDCGFNTMTQRATNESKPLLDDLNLHVINMKDSTDWIYYYSSAYYSKWEAEEDQTHWDKVGVKHRDTLGNLIGKPATYLGAQCWSSNGLTSARDSLIYGPSYHQEKSYRRWLYMSPEERYDLRYTPRFRMALSKNPSVPDTQDVCRLYVIVKYRRIVDNDPDSKDSTYVLKEPITLKVSDFPSNGEFDYFYFSDNPDERWYKYPSIIRDPEKAEAMLSAVQGIFRDDKWGGTGVQFCIDWLRTDTLCTLYIDNIEVYDNNGWDQYIGQPEIVADKIKTYASYFKNNGWDNIKYWMGGHEPSSIDEYIPIRVVDSLIQSNPVNAPPLMNTIWAFWNQDLNGESQLERYYNMTQPDKLLVEFHPIQAGYDVPPPFAFEVLRRILQESYSLTQEKKFYYHVQSYGQWKNDDWYVLRRPTVPEYKTTIMLALSHGADGLVQASYDSQPWIPGSYYYGVLGLIGIAPDYEPTDLWYELKNNLIPRLNGKLGQTLMTLNYTGDYLYLGRQLQNLCCGFENSGPTVAERYLTLTEYTGDSTPPPTHFHAGFFSRPNHLFDNYFMLDNLITTNAKTVTAALEAPIDGFINYRYRNIEGLFDTTFNEYGIVTLLTHPAGEGYLYQVAPVILYGGKLIFNETISSEKTLVDDMIIKNGKSLTVNTTYNADRSITITEGGRLVTTTGGTIKFFNDQNLIIEGTATIAGTPQNKLVLDFLNPAERNGIIIKPGGSLTIINCEIRNANTGIFSELNANYLNVQNTEFIDCADYSISIAGRSSGMISTPPRR